MKKCFIIFNVIFLLFGNVLASNIHYAHMHIHEESHHHEVYDCEACLNIENSSNYIPDFDQVSFSDQESNLVIFKYASFIKFNVDKLYFSRAPPVIK